MFEPIHGTAPDKWYEVDATGGLIPNTFVKEKVQLMKPEAAFLSYAMMLELMGEVKAADALKEAALTNIRDPNYSKMKLDELVEKTCSFLKKCK
jgi:isocitrate/isopropylmalate dehydrogenase